MSFRREKTITFAKCDTCDGVLVHRHAVGDFEGIGPKVWFHLRDEDWKDNPHNGVPREGTVETRERQRLTATDFGGDDEEEA